MIEKIYIIFKKNSIDNWKKKSGDRFCIFDRRNRLMWGLSLAKGSVLKVLRRRNERYISITSFEGCFFGIFGSVRVIKTSVDWVLVFASWR